LKIRTLLVGLGGIGFQYDKLRLPRDSHLTHAGLIHNNPNFDLVAVVDSSTQVIEEYKKKYNAAAYNSLDEVPSPDTIELIVIAVPTEYHFQVFESISEQFRPKVVLLEKPTAPTLFEIDLMLKIQAEKNFETFVNFQRFSHPSVVNLAKLIESNSIAGPFVASATITGTILNNGSHLVNLLLRLFPKEEFVVVTSKLVSKSTFQLVRIQSENVIANITVLAEKTLSLFEIDLIGLEHRIKVDTPSLAIEILKRDSDPNFPTFELFQRHLTFPLDELDPLSHVYKQLLGGFEGAKTELCSLVESRPSMELIFKIIEGVD
jgi:predicted dehydrogenase